MQLPGFIVQLGNYLITGCPVLDCLAHEREVLKSQEEFDHELYIFRIVSALQKPFTGYLKIRIGFLQFNARPHIPQGHPDILQIGFVVVFAAGYGIVFKAANRIFLSLSPQSFSADIGSNWNQYIHLSLDNQNENKKQCDEQANDPVYVIDQGGVRI
ncbi:MAG: hypothetical protein WCA64_12505 [Gallionella sp.]